jgi:geranylgeranyl pyrophosphate synthase
LRQGIITLPVIYYLDNEPDDETVENIIQGKRVSSLEFDRLIQSIRDSGSIEKTINEANEYVARSLEILSEFPESQPRSGLIDLARFTVQRTK